VIIGDIMKEFLGIQGSAQEEGEVSVGGLDDVGDLVDGLSAVKGVLVGQAILDAISEGDSVPEGF